MLRVRTVFFITGFLQKSDIDRSADSCLEEKTSKAILVGRTGTETLGRGLAVPKPGRGVARKG